MLNRTFIVVLTLFGLSGNAWLFAQGKPQGGDEGGKPPGPPPARVVVDNVTSGTIAPQNDYIGTVMYKEVSNVASEMAGKVQEIYFEEGQRVNKGDMLLKMDDQLLLKTLESTQAQVEQTEAELKNARAEFERQARLFKERVNPESEYDDARYQVMILENKKNSLQSSVERIKVQLEKKKIHAPFDGIIIDKKAELGEWLSEGEEIATLANQRIIDVEVDVPGDIIEYIAPGAEVELMVGGEPITGKIQTIIPRGNIATRTFPVKVRIKDNQKLMEGMEASVRLPIGQKQQCLTVNRDAVINKFGQNVIYAVKDSAAQMYPVEVIGYSGLKAGVKAEGLEEGALVVVKGNERLQEGQPVEVIEGGA